MELDLSYSVFLQPFIGRGELRIQQISAALAARGVKEGRFLDDRYYVRLIDHLGKDCVGKASLVRQNMMVFSLSFIN